MPEAAEGSGAEQGLMTPSRGAGGPKVPAWADISNGSCDTAQVGRFLLSSPHQPGFPHTSWCSSRAASLQDSASAFLAISGPFFSSQCCSSIVYPEQLQQNQILPRTGWALSSLWGHWPARSHSSAVPVLGRSSPTDPGLCYCLRDSVGRGARSPPACSPPHLQTQRRPGRDHELRVSLPGLCMG